MAKTPEETYTDITTLTTQIASLYLNQKFSDVTFNISGQKIYAHKVILATRSPYFEALLYDEASQESSQLEIEIKDTSLKAFQALLYFIYTAKVTLTGLDVDLMLELLALAHQYSFSELENVLVKNLKPILNVNNICSIFNTANLYDLEDLKNACHTFSDKHASEIIESDCFNEFTEVSLVSLLQRNTFYAPEINIFKSVAKWCEFNSNIDSLLIKKCVRLSWLSEVDIVSTVWPSKLFDNEDLLSAIAEIVEEKTKEMPPRALLLVDKNLATPEQYATVLTGSNTDLLLAGNRIVEKYASHVVGNQDGFTIKLGSIAFVNHICMRLWDDDNRFYSYYVEVSIDGKKWKNVIDYRTYSCRSVQTLYFPQEVVQYIKVVGTNNTANNTFHLIFFEAYFKNKIPKLVNGIIVPTENVASVEKKAVVIQGKNPKELINGNFKNYTDNQGFTYHMINSGSITVQLAQPFVISSMKLLLWDQDDRSYRYHIETSVNKSNWETVVERRNENCKSWQTHRFKEIPVVFIRITGTQNTANNGFHVVHLECPVNEE